jgi:hypothetical protein
MVENSIRVQSSDASSDALEDLNDPHFAHYRYLRSRAERTDIGTDEPAPLFLSSQAEGHGAAGSRSGPFTPSRILTGLFAGSVVAMGLALFSVEGARDVIVNAKASLEASLMGVSPVQAKAAMADAAQVQSVPHDVPVAKPDQPSRDEIAAAYQAAIKSQIVIQEAPSAAPAPPVAPAAASSIRHLDPDELAALLKRARGLLAIGDIASARLLLERAADAQEADAALMLARTYDPEVLGKSDARSVTPDPEKARNWYRKAAELGSQQAQQRLAEMQN